MRPHRRQPTRLPRPWDSPGKNIGVGCHFLLHCMKVKSESEVAQSCPTPIDPMDCSLPGPSVHGDFPRKSTGVGCHCLLRLTLYRRLEIVLENQGFRLCGPFDSIVLSLTLVLFQACRFHMRKYTSTVPDGHTCFT